MNFKCYNTDDDRLETNFSISPKGIITSDWGKEKPHWILLIGTGVMDGDHEIFEHDLYLDTNGNLHIVTFMNGCFVFENDYANPFYVHKDCDVLKRSKFIGNNIYQPQNL